MGGNFIPRISVGKRVVIAITGYGVLALFGLAYFVLGRTVPYLTTTQDLFLSVAIVAPVVLALLWEHLKGVKVGQIEIALNQVAPALHVELASEIQDLQASVPLALIEALGNAVANSDFKLVEINLRSAPYWWSTRLYLLAALAQEYTQIDRFVFVEHDGARVFVGTSAPATLRKALRRKFPDLERVFRQVQQSLPASLDTLSEIQNIIHQWSMQPLFSVEESGRLAPEAEIKKLTTSASLREWLQSALETESRPWSGERPSDALYARILSSSIPYVPLVNGQRLEKVVNRADLATRLAMSLLSQ